MSEANRHLVLTTKTSWDEIPACSSWIWFCSLHFYIVMARWVTIIYVQCIVSVRGGVYYIVKQWTLMTFIVVYWAWWWFSLKDLNSISCCSVFMKPSRKGIINSKVSSLLEIVVGRIKFLISTNLQLFIWLHDLNEIIAWRISWAPSMAIAKGMTCSGIIWRCTNCIAGQ